MSKAARLADQRVAIHTAGRPGQSSHDWKQRQHHQGGSPHTRFLSYWPRLLGLLGRNPSTRHPALTVGRSTPQRLPVEDQRWSVSTATLLDTCCPTVASALPRCLESRPRKHQYSFSQPFPGRQTLPLTSRLLSSRRNLCLTHVLSSIAPLLSLFVRILL